MGENPPRGATIHYSLSTKAAGEVTLEIFDGEGRRVRRLSSVAKPQLFPEDDPDEPMKAPEAALSGAAGLHRAVWDLRWEGAARLENAKVDLGDPTEGPLAVPGTYRLRLSADGRTEEATLAVLPDPRSRVSAGDRESQLAFALELRADLDRVVADIGEVRAIQAQVDDLAAAPGRRRACRRPGRGGEARVAVRRGAGGALPQSQGRNRLRHSRAAGRHAAAFQSGLSSTSPRSGARALRPRACVRWRSSSRRRSRSSRARLAELKSGELADLEQQSRALNLPRVLLKKAIESEELD